MRLHPHASPRRCQRFVFRLKRQWLESAYYAEARALAGWMLTSEGDQQVLRRHTSDRCQSWHTATSCKALQWL